MARLYLFAEGPTEQTFADTVLKPHLANFGVFMHKPVLIAHCRKKGHEIGSPELIDDGPQTAPSKRIAAEFPDYEDAKTRVGPQAAARIGLTQIRSQCPHFDAWLERLEKLGSEFQD